MSLPLPLLALHDHPGAVDAVEAVDAVDAVGVRVRSGRPSYGWPQLPEMPETVTRDVRYFMNGQPDSEYDQLDSVEKMEAKVQELFHWLENGTSDVRWRYWQGNFQPDTDLSTVPWPRAGPMVPLHGAKSQHRGLARHLAREYMTSRLEDRLFRADDGQPDGIEDVPELDRAFNPEYYKWLDRK